MLRCIFWGNVLIVIPSGIPPAEFQGCGVALLIKPSNFQAPSAVLEPPRCLSSFLSIFLFIFLDSSGAACADKWRLLHLSSSPSPHSPCSSPPSWSLEAILAPSWGALGPSCLQAGGSGDHLGSKLRALRGGLGETWVLPGCPGGRVGSKLGLT